MLRNTDDGGVLTDAGVEYGDRDKDDETIFLNIVNNDVGTNLPPNGFYEKKLLMVMKIFKMMIIIIQ